MAKTNMFRSKAEKKVDAMYGKKKSVPKPSKPKAKAGLLGSGGAKRASDALKKKHQRLKDI